MDSSGYCDIAFNFPVENGSPPDAEKELLRGAQGESRCNLEVFYIQVRLVEAVEEHEAIGAGFRDTVSRVGEGGEKGRELDGQGNLYD